MRIPASSLASRRPIQVEMTPMIDVVFLLLVFFLWTTSFQIAEQRLPSSITREQVTKGSTDVPAEEADFEPVVVRIAWAQAAPQWTINGQDYANLSEVSTTLSAVSVIRPDAPVRIDPVAEVPLGHVIEVYDLARTLGFEKVQFAAGDARSS